MANIKWKPERWLRAKEYYESGLSLSEVMKKTKIDRAAISRKAKSEGWIKNNQEKQQLIKDAVRLAVAKSTFSTQELQVHNELVDEKVSLLRLVHRFNEKAVQKATLMLDTVETAAEFKALAEGVDRVTLTAKLNERHASPAQTTIQNNQGNFSSMSDADLVAEAKRLKNVNEFIASS